MPAVLPDAHRKYLRLKHFVFRCRADIFPAEEYQLLLRYGSWMEALASGAIPPLTPAQEKFLRVVRQESEPTTIYERAWKRLAFRRQFEETLRKPSPRVVQTDYGIVDWDLDHFY